MLALGTSKEKAKLEKLETGVRRLRKGRLAEQFYGEFVMYMGACPFLGEYSLCMLQVEKGRAALPYVCRSYPRGEAYMMSGYLKRSLSPSCEGVLKLLWDLPDSTEFRSDQLPKAEHKRITPKIGLTTFTKLGIIKIKRRCMNARGKFRSPGDAHCC